MKNKFTLQKKLARPLNTIIFLYFLIFSNHLFADGSKDLYPNGVTGLRAYLRSSTQATENWPFPNEGIHYVYAKEGERITLASSSQINGGNSKIRLYAPNGSIVVNNNTIAGQIPNRSSEIAGPQLFGQTGGNRYTPIYYQVPANGAGIYRIEFVSRGTADPQATFNANDNWVQDNKSGIMAWDISVINPNNTAFISGRVYTNVLNLSLGFINVNSNGFYGIVYPLTKDGYTYQVKNNGQNGIHFTFFTNNNGFLNQNNQLPVYKSLNGSTPSFLNGKVHNPNDADTQKNITHKIFYTKPATDLPSSSVGAVPNGNTWLKNPVTTPNVSNVSVVGVEGTNGQISNKGGYIKFNADVQGNYNITIESTPTNPNFVTRVLTGASSAGANQIYWDGKDGNGNASPVGTFPVKITIRLQGAEVHFPYIDVEYNRLGIIIELLNYANLNQVVSDIVYWNDVDIPNANSGTSSSPKNNSHLPPANSIGISSNANGHKWGLNGNGYTNTFGNEKSIDTWTFIKAQEQTTNSQVVVKIADLMINSVTPNNIIAYDGDQITYTIKVKNGGPSNALGAPFTFKIPNGLMPQTITFSSNSCGNESVPLNYNPATNSYSSKLNLPSNCEITYTITLVVSNSAIAGTQLVVASILRPNDITDPDATNPDIMIPPTDAQYECSNNGLGGSCNNIKTNNTVMVSLVCYNPIINNNIGIPANFGVTLLKRAGANNGGWPMNRNSAYMVLESNTKGFVITRMTSDPTQTFAANHISKITNPIEGMMVYDIFGKCLKIYADGDWKCFSKPACP